MPEPMMRMSARDGSEGERMSTSSGYGGARCQNEVVGLATGSPGPALPRRRRSWYVAFRSRRTVMMVLASLTVFLIVERGLPIFGLPRYTQWRLRVCVLG